MFKANSDSRPFEMLPGIVRRTLVSEKHMTLCEITLLKDSVVASHSHEHEQAGYVVRGRMRFKIGDEERVVEAGDGYLIPGSIPHEVMALEDSIAIDVFSPPRLEYLD